jgi:hypothetical protein
MYIRVETWSKAGNGVIDQVIVCLPSFLSHHFHYKRAWMYLLAIYPHRLSISWWHLLTSRKGQQVWIPRADTSFCASWQSNRGSESMQLQLWGGASHALLMPLPYLSLHPAQIISDCRIALQQCLLHVRPYNQPKLPRFQEHYRA